MSENDLINKLLADLRAKNPTLANRIENLTRNELGDPLMEPEETAEYIGNTPGTLAAWRHTKKYDLPYVKIGALVRYRLSDVNDWLARRTMNLPRNASAQRRGRTRGGELIA